jgi:predicted helicase
LLETDHIYLRISSKKKEKNPDGGKDENVFDIQQGTAILLAVRRPEQTGVTNVWHAELWGDRQAKYDKLSASSLTETPWTQVFPVSPNYLFIQRDSVIGDEYDEGRSIAEIFPVNSIGIATARDGLTIHFSAEELKQTVDDFIALDIEDARTKFNLGKDVSDWGVERAQKDVGKLLNVSSTATEILYRPFDTRFTYYTGKSGGFHCRPRQDVMQHMLGEGNLAMVFSRGVETEAFEHIFCAESIAGHHSVSIKEVNFEAPLYLRGASESAKAGGLFQDRRCNISRAFLDSLGKALGLSVDPETGLPEDVSPENIFHYIYAVVYSPGYRARYSKALRIGFPRVPLTANLTLFRALAEKGRELVALHLFNEEEAPQINRLITKFRKPGTNMVEKVEYDPATRHVHINDKQYFEDVPAETWNFHIGGYRVCEKWLKDRKGRTLSYDDLQHWQRVVVALTETRRLMVEIDALIPEWPLR